MKKHSSGAEFFDFEKNPDFVGRFLGSVKREKDAEGADKEDNKKAGAVIGYLFHDLITDEETIIGNSHAIAKAVSGSTPGGVFRIKFLGKTTNAKNQPVNRFAIDEAENEQEEMDLIKSVQRG